MLNKRILVLMFLLLFLPLVGCFPPPTNQTPILTSDPITIATIGVLYTYDVNATDPDGDTLIYSLAVKPTGMTISSASGLIKWTPTAKGNYAVVVKVSDGVLDISQSFTITVSAVEPGLTGIVVVPKTMTLIVGESKTITSVTAHYSDGSTANIALGNCTYSSSVPGVATVIASEGHSVNAIAEGTTSITVDYAGKSDTIVVTVSKPLPINHAPSIISIPVTIATVGITYFYDVNATDPNGDIVTYSLTTCPGGMVISSANGLIMWNPTAEGNYAVVVKVSDGSLSDTQGFTIVVSKPTVPPETYTITSSAGTGGSISPSGDVTVNKGANIVFTITPDTNYNIADVLVDGGSVGAVASYTFTNVAKDHTIHATFSTIEPEPEIKLIRIEVSPDTMTLVKGDSQSFTVTAYYDDGNHGEITSDCTYVSDDEGVATVVAGEISAVAKGTAIITVSYKGETDTLQVTVSAIFLTSIVVLPETMALYPEDSKAIESVTAHYNDGTEAEIDLDDCIYETSGYSIATVDASGIVKAIELGTATITVSYIEEEKAKAVYIEKTDTVEVKVIGKIHNIDADKYYDTITDAISEASPGDTITVAAGTYNELFDINKSLTLQGEDRDTTIIDVGGGFEGIKIVASNVIVDGFTMQNTKYFLLQTDTSNIQDNVVLKNNIFSGGRVQLYSINNLEFSYNQISGSPEVWYSSGIILGNTMSNVLMGISAKGCDGLTIQDNTIAARVGENTDAGILIMHDSNNIIVERNIITGFTAGERQYYNNGTDGAGIIILSSTDCTVNENDLFDNTLGVLVEKAVVDSGIHINDNNFEGNTEFGVLNCELWTGEDGTYTPASATIDATCNWWNDESGPYHPTANSGGLGDTVSDYVDFSDWE